MTKGYFKLSVIGFTVMWHMIHWVFGLFIEILIFHFTHLLHIGSRFGFVVYDGVSEQHSLYKHSSVKMNQTEFYLVGSVDNLQIQSYESA